jgi:hypothetical protein
MNGRCTLLLCFLNLLVASWIYCVEWQRKAPATLEFEKQLLLHFDPQRCKGISLDFLEKPDIHLVKEKDIFFLTSSLKRRAHPQKISKILGYFSALKQSTILPLQALPQEAFSGFLERYGLAPPQLKVTFHFDSSDPLVLSLGNLQGEEVYLRLQEEEEIHLQSLQAWELLAIQEEELYDPYGIRFNPQEVLRITLLHQGKPLVFERIRKATQGDPFLQGEWQEVAPYRFPVDPDKLFSFIEGMEKLRVKEGRAFEEVRSWFENAETSLLLEKENPSEKHFFRITLHEQAYWLYEEGSLRAFSLENVSSLLKSLQQPPWSYIQAHVFPREEMQQISFELRGSPYRFAYEKRGEQWFTQQEPVYPVPEEFIETLKTILSGLRMEKTLGWDLPDLSPYHLDRPQQKWVLVSQKESIELEIGGSLENPEVFAKRSDLPLLFTLPSTELKELWSLLIQEQGAKNFHQKIEEIAPYLHPTFQKKEENRPTEEENKK